MSETKTRKFLLELTDAEITAFIEMCYQDGTTPGEVLEGFICDLTGAERTNGSDERMCANKYYERCGYGYFPGDYHPFTQWLLNEYDETAKEDMEDFQILEAEKEYLSHHPEEGGIEDIEKAVTEARQAIIERYYKNYTEDPKTRTPDTLEEALKGVREYMDTVAKIERSDT